MLGKAIPKHTSGMCTANDSACICRASSRCSCSTGGSAAARSCTGRSVVIWDDSAYGQRAEGSSSSFRSDRAAAAGRKECRETTPVENAQIADRLDAFAALLELGDANPYTARAYRRAAETIRGAPSSVAELVRSGRVRELRGIGPGIEARLRELVETGEIAELTELERELSPGLVGLGRYLGLGGRWRSRGRSASTRPRSSAPPRPPAGCRPFPGSARRRRRGSSRRSLASPS